MKLLNHKGVSFGILNFDIKSVAYINSWRITGSALIRTMHRIRSKMSLGGRKLRWPVRAVRVSLNFEI